MLTEQNKKDIRAYYREGYSKEWICKEYEGLDPREICNICDEEDEYWSASSKD